MRFRNRKAVFIIGKKNPIEKAGINFQSLTKFHVLTSLSEMFHMIQNANPFMKGRSYFSIAQQGTKKMMLLQWHFKSLDVYLLPFPF